MNETGELAKFVVDTLFKDLSPSLMDESKIFALDTVSAGFVGSVQPWSKIVVDDDQPAGRQTSGHAHQSDLFPLS